LTTYSYNISNQKVDCIFDATINQLENYAPANAVVIITDHHIAALYSQQLSAYRVITFVAGESNKTQSTVDQIIQQLILMEIDREALIVGVGGGVVTDIVGFVASIYKRGLRFGFIPTTILAMVDAAIGGKNGVNVGLYKNMVGTIVQPSFILFDYTFLQTLPEAEWRNGFAEIIKHACIRDAEMFSNLQQHQLIDYIKDAKLLTDIIQKNVAIKLEIVAQDTLEKKERLFLNFGHTVGHAIENSAQLKHGYAVAIGMAFACQLSEKIIDFNPNETAKVIQLLKQYQLPTTADLDVDMIINLVQADKKRTGKEIRFVLLSAIGDASIQAIPIETIRAQLIEISS